MFSEFRQATRAQLTRVITAVMVKYPHFSYYQGYHDVASVFLLTLGENLAFYCLEQFTILHLHLFLTETFDKCIIPRLKQVEQDI